MIEEPESAALARHLDGRGPLATSRVAIVEVARATAIANPSPEVRHETARLLASCLLLGVTDEILGAARTLASASVRTLDAIHLASALHLEAAEVVAYDRRLLAAAHGRGLVAASPGAW